MWGNRKRLREAGVLGLNERNAEYITLLNPRRYYPRVDDK
ncbi:MAG TPA: alpha-L-glutamate ligase-like protein, partial [Woeseiaceae bacterium]|nr:alpha-L-glutamate ligase-like protein [Woeseiaceae bacterium]